MKKVILVLSLIFMQISYGQEVKQIPQIIVNGEGKVKVVPDQATIAATVETKGNNAKEVKKQNDEKIDAILKFIKKMNLAPADFKTQRVSLNPQYDYEKKKHSYNATQTIEILLRDLSNYDELMEGLVNQGINRIDNVTFQSSKMKQYESEARKLAMKEAKLKAEDYVSVLGQKVGRALTISDNSQTYYPQPMYVGMKTMQSNDMSAPRETLAAGEITITATVTVNFILE
ncbi:MAG: SIMPL domain-containing protein [Flavobacterium sp.]|uniref:SIMPL domain-containing protein n=1 Tax=Flavobacterium sp. TaxID=239 RepID=UPI001B3F969B|nr:SIMPL domain-containing protein [Flavobacterium sp.]MBP6146918.1 SIMPL domain-containing protein [Flavobacterium sp.]MBP7183382.1 SIMPL domain-containing protein [Flavobacterium sp.]MBP7318069.1 SIMPL domain-containing protein [Flavobacterium sp.]MBP8886519.1 SIMPL domain-containing protein [Flavobacterium sp.]HRL71188.1 SIMPL domain-containing protein [Flavobacterium sp.]